MTKRYTVKELLKRHNVPFHVSYIHKLCSAGKIPAVKWGPMWAITDADFLNWYNNRRPVGAPPKVIRCVVKQSISTGEDNE